MIIILIKINQKQNNQSILKLKLKNRIFLISLMYKILMLASIAKLKARKSKSLQINKSFRNLKYK